MRFVVFGAGAIGGVLGARLAQAGEDVTLVARAAHARAIRQSGLRLDAPEKSATLALPVAEAASELAFRGDEVVLLATKSQDSAGALRDLAAVARPETPIVCVQNGVANERVAARFFADVYGVCVMCPAEHIEPGVVVAQSAPLTGLLDIGRFPRGSDDVSRSVAEAFRRATFESEVRDDVMAWKYRKLVLNLANAVEATCARGTGRRELIDLLRREGEEVLRAAHIDVVAGEEDEARRGDLLQVREVEGRARAGSSTWQSLARRTGAVETDYLNGEIALIARRIGRRAPINARLTALARHAARNNVRPGGLGVDQLRAELGR
jgi:2-dehydropantoate 2-reductase